MQELVRLNPDRIIVVVAHKTTNRLLNAHYLGIDPRDHVTDQQGRPIVVSTGESLHAVLS